MRFRTARLAAVGLAIMSLMCGAAGAQRPHSGFPDALDVRLTRKNPLPAMANLKPDEGPVRSAIMEQAENLFMSGRFDELEKIAVSFRTKKARTPSGAWSMDLFYMPFASCECSGDNQAFMLRSAAAYGEKYPSSPTPLIIKAELLFASAWQARGNTWARDVKPEQWKGFYGRLNEAQQLLEDNADIVARDPAASALMMKILSMTAIGDADFLASMDAAAKITPAYAPLYFNTMHLYYPDWRDNPRTVEMIARRALVASEASESRSLYARIYLHAWFEYGNELYALTKVDQAYLREAVFDLLKRYPDRYNFEMFGMMACSLEDWKMAAPIFHRLQELPMWEYEWDGGVNYQGCRSQMYAINGVW